MQVAHGWTGAMLAGLAGHRWRGFRYRHRWFKEGAGLTVSPFFPRKRYDNLSTEIPCQQHVRWVWSENIQTAELFVVTKVAWCSFKASPTALQDCLCCWVFEKAFAFSNTAPPIQIYSQEESPLVLPSCCKSRWQSPRKSYLIVLLALCVVRSGVFAFGKWWAKVSVTSFNLPHILSRAFWGLGGAWEDSSVSPVVFATMEGCRSNALVLLGHFGQLMLWDEHIPETGCKTTCGGEIILTDLTDTI